MILWASAEFGFVTLSDAHTTGSSLMPQKKNPDVAELTRGKTGRLVGNLVSLLTTLKGLPMTYNRDLQEDKEPLFDSVDTIKLALAVFAEMIRGMEVNAADLRPPPRDPMLLATDLADYLVNRGVPFRQAHEVIGRTRGPLRENETCAECIHYGRLPQVLQGLRQRREFGAPASRPRWPSARPSARPLPPTSAPGSNTGANNSPRIDDDERAHRKWHRLAACARLRTLRDQGSRRLAEAAGQMVYAGPYVQIEECSFSHTRAARCRDALDRGAPQVRRRRRPDHGGRTVHPDPSGAAAGAPRALGVPRGPDR